jgi:hypothetical protein
VGGKASTCILQCSIRASATLSFQCSSTVHAVNASLKASIVFCCRYVGEMSLLLPERRHVRLSVLDFWGNREVRAAGCRAQSTMLLLFPVRNTADDDALLLSAVINGAGTAAAAAVCWYACTSHRTMMCL